MCHTTMTNLEKYQLIVEKHAYYFTADMVINNSTSGRVLHNECARSISVNSCSAYFDLCDVKFENGEWIVSHSTYYRVDLCQIASVLDKQLDDTVLIIDRKGKVLWYKSPILEKNGKIYYIMGFYAYSGEQIERIIDENTRLKELTEDGTVFVRGNHYSMAALDAVFDKLERLKNLVRSL